MNSISVDDKVPYDCMIKAWSDFTDSLVRYDAYYDQLVALKKVRALNSIKRVIFNDPATIIIWADGTKTVVKCAKDEKFDPEKGLAMAIAKKAIGNEGWYYDIFKECLPKEDT